jgi:hypothetical protein
MDLLWAVPPIALAVGAAVAIVQLHGIAEAAADLQRGLQRFSEVHGAVAEVRSSSAAARAGTRTPGR